MGMETENLVQASVKLPELSESIVIEFVGPTGGGKTTNCNEFSRELNAQKLTVATFAEFKKWFYKAPRITQASILFNAIFLKGNMFSFISLLIRNNLLHFDAIKRFFKLSVFNSALQQFKKNKLVDVIILDQWIIQGLWSATIFRNRNSSNVSRELSRFFFPVDFVFYFDVDAKTASERIGGRDAGRSRFDKMDPDKRLAETEKFNQYLFELFQASGCANKKIFSTLESPSKNAREFGSYFIHSLVNIKA